MSIDSNMLSTWSNVLFGIYRYTLCFALARQGGAAKNLRGVACPKRALVSENKNGF